MSALSGNGNNGSRPSLLAKLFGFTGTRDSRNGGGTHIMTSDGAASVDIEKLLASKSFKESAAELKGYLNENSRP